MHRYVVINLVRRVTFYVFLASLATGPLGEANSASAVGAVTQGTSTPIFAQWSYTHQQLEALVPKARPEDVATPEAVVKAMHESINGPVGPWNGNRLRSLCLPNVLFAELEKDNQGRWVVHNHPIDSFVRDIEDMHKTTAWYEHVTKTDVTRISRDGALMASVSQQTIGATAEGGKPVEYGKSIALLIHDGNRWWVISDAW